MVIGRLLTSGGAKVRLPRIPRKPGEEAFRPGLTGSRRKRALFPSGEMVNWSQSLVEPDES
jgi:hypothetical protein